MSIRNHLSALFFSLVLVLPLFRGGLGALYLQSAIWIIYAVGLLVPLVLLRKQGVRLLVPVDVPFLMFVLFYISTVAYTISDDYRSKLLLMLIMPLYYFNARLFSHNRLIDLSMKYLMSIFLGFSIYLLIWLSSVGFQYRIYLDYTNALFKVSYLETTIYSMILILYLSTREKITIVSCATILYLLFITLISGSRFAILFAAFTIFLFILFSLKKIKRITVKGFVASFLAFVAVIVGLIIITEAKIDVGNYFSYTASRMEKLFVGDNSVSARIKLINESLHAINSNAFLGSGISSSEKILGADYAHNMILETWLESGIVNATLLTMILLYGGVIAVKIMRRSHQGMFVGLAYIYLALSHMKSFSVTDSRVLVFFYGTVIAMSLCSDRALAKDH